MDSDKAGAPAYLLMASGILGILYSLVYLVWTLIPLGITVYQLIRSIMDGADAAIVLGVSAVTLAIPLAQCLGFVVTLLMSLVTAVGGARLNAYRSKGVVVLGILTSIAVPLLALVLNAGSAMTHCGLGCLTGCLLGNIPTMLLLLFGLVASAGAVVALMDPVKSGRFDRA